MRLIKINNMTNKQAEIQLRRLIFELDVLDDEDFNADNREKIQEAIKLLEK
jgi:Fe-S-cluster formation regulator IscX/YfhJ